jgi:hypothetical protein
MSKRWTGEEIEILKYNYSIGIPTDNIGILLNRTGESVRKKASRLGIEHLDKSIIQVFDHESYIKALNKKNSTLIPLEKYIDTRTKILHKCNKCDKIYKSSPRVRLRTGCKYCAVHGDFGSAKTTNQYILELKNIGVNVYPIEPYVNAYTKILHKCKDCGKEEYYKPSSKLEGYGCRYCRRTGSGISNTEPCLLYLIKINDFPNIENLFKLGITSKSISDRMLSAGIKNYEIILERHFTLGIEAIKLEKIWLSNIKKFKFNTELLKNGNTETFIYEA